MIYLVVGHPRSGTSMMMRAVEAGGLTVARSIRREAKNTRDGTYLANRDGLYEVDPKEVWVSGWPRMYEGQAVKVLTSWVRHVSAGDYSVAFMLRDSEEIRQSFEASHREKRTTLQIEREIDEALSLLHVRRDVHQITLLNYRDVLEHPRESLSKLNWPLDVTAAASVPDVSQYRFRRELLSVGL